jgi:hypothetical protein
VTITVNANQAPVLANIEAGTLAYGNGSPPIQITNTLTVADADDTNIESATVSISNNFVNGEDQLQFTTQNGITGNYVPATGILTLTGSATLVNYQTALRSINYNNSAGIVTPSVRTVSFVVNDGDVNSNSQLRNINVGNDAPPTAVNDSATVNEDAAAAAVNVLTNDTDTDGGPKNIASLTQPANGTVVGTGPVGAFTGLTYQPNANYCNNPPGTTLDTFTYTLNGGSIGTVTMTVTCFNDAPAITDTKPAAVIMSEDGSPTAFSLTLNATDADGDTITWSISSPASHGTATATGTGTSKVIGYTPTANYNGSDTFTVQVSDGNGGTDTIIVNVTIDAVNEPDSSFRCRLRRKQRYLHGLSPARYDQRFNCRRFGNG